VYVSKSQIYEIIYGGRTHNFSQWIAFKMKTANFSETMVCVSCSMWHHIPQDKSHICSAMSLLSLKALIYQISDKLIKNVKLVNVLKLD
jgi:hypothetical protein